MTAKMHNVEAFVFHCACSGPFRDDTALDAAIIYESFSWLDHCNSSMKRKTQSMARLPPYVSRLSVRSLLLGISVEFHDEPVAYGTGFIVQSAKGPCLVTARHCLTGRHHYSGKLLDPMGAIPFSLIIYHRIVDEQGKLTNSVYLKKELLYHTDGSPRWFEHPHYADLCDFACLPLTEYDDCELFPISTEQYTTELLRPNTSTDDKGFIINSDDRMFLHVSDQVSVIGYPFGAVTLYVYPLWATGHLSSEPYLSSPLGATFVDCRSRGGQSGSPVYAVRAGSYESVGGDSISFDGYAYMFIGVYSGRIREDSDMGIIWDANVLNETVLSIERSTSAKMPTDRCIAGPVIYMPTLADKLRVSPVS